MAGKIDVIVDGPWASGGYKEALGDNLAVAPMPAGPAGTSQPLTGADGWYINTNAPNADLAANFALEMVKPENEQVFVDTPATSRPTRRSRSPTRSPRVRRRGRRPASPGRSARSSTTTGATSATRSNLVIEKGTDPTKAATDACTTMDKANGK